MKTRKFDISWMVIALCVFAYLLNILFTTGIYDINDGLNHYLIARYAPIHPELFLDHWGKPLFTLFASPFAQLGVKGVMLFNVLLYIFTARLLVLILKKLDFSFAWIAPILLAVSPAYFFVTMGGLTEVLFAFIVVLGLWLFITERFLLAALAISWLPFARSEAYFIFPLFGLAFLIKKQWKAIFLMALGPLVMSTFAWFVLGDFFWMISQNPYTGAKNIYGSGKLLHFVLETDVTVGRFVFGGAIVGIIIDILDARKRIWDGQSILVGIVIFSFLAVFSAHSIFWWKGLYGSLGLTRVLATVAPLSVILCVLAIDRIAQFLNDRIAVAIVLSGVIYSAFNFYSVSNIAYQADVYEQMIKELSKWHKTSKHASNPNIWYQHPAIGYYLNIDNFDKNESQPLWFLNPILPSNAIKNGGLIIYDGGRAANEGKTSKEMLFADRHLSLIHSVQAEGDLFEMNNSIFELLVFEKQLDATNDTLAYADLRVNRPILANRLKRIQTDTIGRPYFIMKTFTSWCEIFAFWEKDRASWESKRYEFKLNVEKPIDVVLVHHYQDGELEYHYISSGVFAIPQPSKPLIKTTLGIHKPDKDEVVRVYGWTLTKASATSQE